LNETHDLVKSYYDPQIETYRSACIQAWIILGVLVLIAVITLFVIDSLENSYPEEHWQLVQAFILVALLGGLLHSIEKLMSFSLKLSNARREKEIYLSYPPNVVPGVKKAFLNKSNHWLKSNALTNTYLDQWAGKYAEFNHLSTDELKRRLIAFGVLSNDGPVERAPKNDDEGWLFAVYSQRQMGEKLEQDETSAAYKDHSINPGAAGKEGILPEGTRIFPQEELRRKTKQGTGASNATLSESPSSSTHELAETYDHHIKWNKERFRYYARWGCLLVAVGLFFIYLSFATPYRGGQELWSSIIGYTVAVFSLTTFLTALPYLLEVRKLEKLRKVALSYPAYISVSVNRAHINVSSWLANPKEVELKPKLFGKLCVRYCELEKLSTEELRQKLSAADVWNPNNGWYEKGRTLDEGLMMAIYTRRTDKETAELEATQATHKKLSHEAALAPDLQVRKHVEQQKEAIARELGELDGEPNSSFNWSLKKLGGSVRVFTRDGQTVRAAFTLPIGVYRLDVVDDDEEEQRPPRRLGIGDAPYELKIQPPVSAGRLLITDERETTDTVPLD
jgi:uncharacterized membrane protein